MSAPTRIPWPRGIHAIDGLLRDRGAFLERLVADADLGSLARALLVATLVGAAAIGAALGLYRGGLQVLFAAIKLPMAVLLTVCISAPMLSTLRRAREGRAQPRRDLVLVLGACALSVILAAGCLPLYLLGYVLRLDGRSQAQLAVVCCAVGGVAGLALVWRGLARLSEGRHRLVGTLLVLGMCIVGGQMTWTLRPWLQQRPWEPIVWVRDVEGSVLNVALVDGGLSLDRAPRLERLLSLPSASR